MKIIYCIAGTYNSGGMERVLATKANYLVNHGYEVSIITTDQRGQSSFFHLDNRIKCYDLNINYEENNGKTLLNKLLHYPFKQWKHRRRLMTCLKQLQADIVISMFCNDASLLWRIKDGSRKVLEIHFSRYKRLQYGRKGIWRWMDKWRSKMDEKTVRKYDRFVVLTHEDKTYWGDLSNVVVIPNPRSFSPPHPSELMRKKVIAIGRYGHQKGFDNLIKAWSIVHRTYPDWTLDIIGNGEWKKRLQEQIDELALNRSVYLKSPTNDIKRVYQEASILVMSSRYEGLPMVLLEAQSCGLPIVSFACKCGPRDIITDGEDGYLVPEGNLHALANQLIKLMKDEELRKRMGKVAQKKSEQFSQSIIMEQWEKLFHKISIIKE